MMKTKEALDLKMMRFGKKEWNKFFGDVGEEPPLPKDLSLTMSQPCPFWPSQKIQDTHFLILLPREIEAQLLTLNTFQSLLINKSKCSYASFDKFVRQELGNSSIESHWILMTYDVVPNTRRQRFEAQKSYIESIETNDPYRYRLPSVLEATACIIAAYLYLGKTIYSDDPWTYTRCMEKVNLDQYPVSVGGFSNRGVFIHDCRYVPTHDYIGVGAVKSFESVN